MKTPTYQVLPLWPAQLAWPAWPHPQSALPVDEEKQGGGGTFDICTKTFFWNFQSIPAD